MFAAVSVVAIGVWAFAIAAPANAAEGAFGIEPGSFATEISTNQAGAHPDLHTTFGFNRGSEETSEGPAVTTAGGTPRNLNLVLPKGLIGAPAAVATCTMRGVTSQGIRGSGEAPLCPLNTAIGVAHVRVRLPGTAPSGNPPGLLSLTALVFNIVPYPGEPAAFAFNAFYPVRIDTHLRADGDYGVTVESTELTEAAIDVTTDITLWGVPADHTGPGSEADNQGRSFGGPSGEPRIPFLTNPSGCSGEPLTSSLSVASWQSPTFTDPVGYSLGQITNCDQVEFAPTVDAQPTTNLADSPSGLDFKLHLPQHNGPFVGANEVQQLQAGFFSAGRFRLGFGGDKTGATATGDLTESSTTVANLDTATGAFLAGEEIKGAGIPPETTIASVGTGTITLSQPATASATATAISADLPFSPPAPLVQRALEALPSIGAGNIAVTRASNALGSPGAFFTFTFQGALGDTDVAQLSAESLEEFGSATVTTLRDGIPGGSPGEEIATAQLKDAVVKFPAGMSVNPGSANGLGACTLAQAGVSASGQSNGRPNSCPDSSKLGTVEAVSPAIDHPLPGSLYLAAQNENPFGSLLALYLVIEDVKSGINVKLPGKVEADPNTGRLTVSFKNNPQLPIEDLNLSLFKGDRAALRTPTACGEYTTASTLTPWTSPQGDDSTPQSSFKVTNGPSGGACLPTGAQAPNQPTFSAGTLNPTAKAFSPFVMKLTRADGSQELKSIDATLPKGLLGKLAGTPYCPDASLAAAAAKSGKAEQASPSCPAASQVGTVTVGAGAGSDPIFVSGKAYLAGPYKGAPLSLAIITPAVAGPFDLGTVIVRTALNVDPITTQIHAVSDPIPTILQGIPLDIRSIALNINKPNFTLNPTSCDPSAVLGGATSVFDQTASLSNPFQVGDCSKLKFGPSVKFALKGQTKRTGNPALAATIKYPKGGSYANIAKTAVLLPKTEFIDNAHINNPCTRVQFNAGACPPSSILGTATAYTPLLDQPLTGPVYFRSNGGERELPDMVVDLGGQIHVTLVGFIDSVPIKGTESARVRTRFANVPDAPVSKFTLKLYGGKRGLIENSVNLCKHPGDATVQMEAQNGDSTNFDTPFAAPCGKKKHKTSKRAAHG